MAIGQTTTQATSRDLCQGPVSLAHARLPASACRAASQSCHNKQHAGPNLSSLRNVNSALETIHTHHSLLLYLLCLMRDGCYLPHRMHLFHWTPRLMDMTHDRTEFAKESFPLFS